MNVTHKGCGTKCSAPFKIIVNILNEENYFICFYSNQLATFQLSNICGPLTISLGIPQKHTFSENNEDGSKIETDGSSGYFLGIKFPIGVDSDSCKMLTSD